MNLKFGKLFPITVICNVWWIYTSFKMCSKKKKKKYSINNLIVNDYISKGDYSHHCLIHDAL